MQRHACVDHVANELEDGGEDFPAAACAQRSPAAVVKSQERRTHITERFTTGRDAVGVPGSRVKPHHAVIEHETQLRGCNARSKCRHDGLSERNHIAFAVCDADMRGSAGSIS